MRPWQRRAQALLATLGQQVKDQSPATRRRWPWTWVGDDSLFKKSGHRRGLVGTWWSGQAHRVRRGIDGRLLGVVSGEGTRVIPVDFTVRRPDPAGPGRPCRDHLTWWQGRRDRTWAAIQRRCRQLPPRLVVAESWLGDAKVRAQVAIHPHGSLVVEGQRTDVFHRLDGPRVTGRAYNPEWEMVRIAGGWRIGS